MDTMLASLPYAFAYLDDIIIVSSSIADHKHHKTGVLKTIRDFGFTLNFAKCTFFMKQLKFLGFIVDKIGRRPDPAKTEAIVNMPPPTNVATLQSFLGMISYYSSFIPNLHKLRNPLNNLLRKNQMWNWSTDCQKSFDELKRTLASDFVLTHFDPNQKIVVAADAANEGIGATIMHEFADNSKRPIAYASRSLTPTERNYSQICEY